MAGCIPVRTGGNSLRFVPPPPLPVRLYCGGTGGGGRKEAGCRERAEELRIMLERCPLSVKCAWPFCWKMLVEAFGLSLMRGWEGEQTTCIGLEGSAEQLTIAG